MTKNIKLNLKKRKSIMNID